MAVKKNLLNIILKINVIKEKANNKYRNLSEEEKEAKREYGRNRYKSMKENAS